MNGTFRSGGHTLARHVVVPTGPEESRLGLILCHGFPIGPLDARRSAGTFPELIERIAHELGYVTMTFNFRGTGTSGGDFSSTPDSASRILRLSVPERSCALAP